MTERPTRASERAGRRGRGAHPRARVLHLQLEGLAPVEATDGDSGLSLARARKFDLIILDLMLPGLDGVTICRAIRRESANAETPILMLTARREESDKVLGLDSGADDYLTKPFGIRELLARIRALLRRGHTSTGGAATGTAAAPITYKHIEIDPARRRVLVGTRDVELTFNEFELLYVLVSSPGIVFSREALLSKVWKDQTFVTVRSVDTLVKRVRKKIEADPGAARSDSHRVGRRLQSRRCLVLKLRWYRSLYWRIALGLIAFLALMLAAEGGIFLWMTDRIAGSMPARSPRRLAELVASDLGDRAHRQQQHSTSRRTCASNSEKSCRPSSSSCETARYSPIMTMCRLGCSRRYVPSSSSCNRSVRAGSAGAEG